MRRNRWPVKIGMGGRFVLEWVAGMVRNTQGPNIAHGYPLLEWKRGQGGARSAA